MEFLKDKFRRNRGGHTRLLKISCEKCDQFLFYYQKDGPGILKRLYLDRINPETNFKLQTNSLVCSKCKTILGAKYLYQKEKRPAIRLFVGAVKKTIIKA
jgi:hypothetical protein